MRKSRTPAGFVPMPCETVARKTLETLPLERTTESDSKTPQKLSKRRLWNARLKDSKTSETSPTERIAARKMPKRCLWNPLNRNKKPMPCETVAKKTLETSPLERIAKRNS